MLLIPRTAALLPVLLWTCALPQPRSAGAEEDRGLPSLGELKATGLERSRFRTFSPKATRASAEPTSEQAREADLAGYRSTIRPLLDEHCVGCHGPDASEGNIRLDTLDPDLLAGSDTEWWTEVFGVVTKGEMPPPDSGQLPDAQRLELVNWLSTELEAASIARRKNERRSAFRRMTRYEYNYALQDLLGLPWDFAKDLPPEPQSEDGFENGSDLLSLSVSQFETYHKIARTALSRATVTGPRPATLYWGVAMRDAAAREWAKQDAEIAKAKRELKDDAEKLAAKLAELEKRFQVSGRSAHYRDLSNGRTAKADWRYSGARYAFAPATEPVAIPDEFDCVAILPNGRGPRLIVELGNQLPDEGTLRVTVRASRVNLDSEHFPSLQLLFGWQASNEGRALLRVSEADTPVTAGPDAPQLIQWDVPLGEIYPRNSVRKTSPMGSMPSPSEYIRLINNSALPSEVQIDFVHVAAPVYDHWPPLSHQQIFFNADVGSATDNADEESKARAVIAQFLKRAWRRPINEREVDTKLMLFREMRKTSDSFEEAVIEVLASALSSPQFLYVANTTAPSEGRAASERRRLDDHALANRLSLFLWCSIPDAELSALADQGRLTEDRVLSQQIARMLKDPRSERLAEHFVFQWLDMKLLEFLNVGDRGRGLDQTLKESMQREPIAMFIQMLDDDASVLDFIHSDYAMLDERLARHYGVPDVYGNEFRKTPLDSRFHRGGLLTQAGVLTMNSAWPDSHPLKRAIWLLECILADPPPPPPPAVPQIDLADPEIAKMTLKERIEDHRNHASCMSCHVKIDPWGIAFENYDAVGRWRERIKGQPIDASSELFNRQTLDGIDGLKRFLLDDRQDQVVRALVTKLTTYALGRPLAFADRADIDAITARVRQNGDGLRTAIEAIVLSDLFRSQ